MMYREHCMQAMCALLSNPEAFKLVMNSVGSWKVPNLAHVACALVEALHTEVERRTTVPASSAPVDDDTLDSAREARGES